MNVSPDGTSVKYFTSFSPESVVSDVIQSRETTPVIENIIYDNCFLSAQDTICQNLSISRKKVEIYPELG